ncbi:hypothetical protein ACFW3D_04390 [Streptomyces sp. NPDC058864]
MDHVVVERQGSGGYRHGPTPYLAVQPELGRSLPPGARAFGRDPEHYDFHAPRCVKDLKPTVLPPALDGLGRLLEPYVVDCVTLERRLPR